LTFRKATIGAMNKGSKFPMMGTFENNIFKNWKHIETRGTKFFMMEMDGNK